MKLLYLHQYFATPEVNAGTRSYEVAKRLVANGHDVTFITSSALLSGKYAFTKGWNELNIEGIKLHVLYLPYSNKDSFMNRIYKFIQFSVFSTVKSLKFSCDAVFATSTPLTIAIPGLIYSKIKKKPLVFEVRDLWPELPIAMEVIKNPIIIKFAKWLEKYTYQNSKRLIGLSPGMCDGIERHGINPKHITLATNSCDTELFNVPKNIGERYIYEKIPYLNGRKLVVYTGTFGLINNVGYLPKLARAVKEIDGNICFIAIGDGMEKESVISEAEKLGVLNDNLFILTPVPKTEIVELLSAADLSLSLFAPIPEMWHNSANKLFDGLASSTPIAINYGGWQYDFIHENKCGITLECDDVVSSAETISKFLSNADVYKQAVKRCNYLANNDFSRDVMVNRIEQTLQDAIND
ncbi:glycosyltransferase [Aliivibrio fischeri]|uniref:glycosyltransferase family 4 protein n=1 Tax=Aliivibrio fischeri TaxID=668 RepID=UPI0012D91A2D|nr:glycosyltransferase family 4 protein [Aliivibrio fischeri]MUK92238.1 glycosyltransferase [Aliivibrio fischeri]